jgi:archaellum component FlaF (FlaF/FlaG flagellin family)
MKKLKQYLPGILILISFLLLGSYIYRDYGISYDEIVQREIGEVNYKYVFEHDNTLDTYLDREYGAGFELPLVALERRFKLTDFNDTFMMRHVVTHLLFLFSMFAGYVLALKLFKNQTVAIATFLMLLLSPRIYAHSYFNTKDIPSLSVVVLCFLAGYYALSKRSVLTYSLAGIVCGFAVGLRLMNMIIAAPLIGYLLIDIIANIRNNKQTLKFAISLILFIILGWFVVIGTWPALWKDPYNNIVEFYHHLSKFRWTGSVLLNGQIIKASDLPWYYIPEWFTITVPIFWQILSVAGITFTLVGFFKNPVAIVSDTKQRLLLMFVFCFIGPVIVVIYLKAVLYDDWRHMYFIYPAFVFLAAHGLKELITTKLKFLVLGTFTLQLMLIVFFFIKYHPNQNVYFNEFVSTEKDNLMHKYELDYWQHSYKQGLKWVAEHSDKEIIYLNNDEIILERNRMCLEPDIRKRFVLTNDESKIDYYVKVFRTEPYKYSREESIHEIMVLGSPILRIRKMK